MRRRTRAISVFVAAGEMTRARAEAKQGLYQWPYLVGPWNLDSRHSRLREAQNPIREDAAVLLGSPQGRSWKSGQRCPLQHAQHNPDSFVDPTCTQVRREPPVSSH